MICTLTIVRYPKWLAWAGLLSMAVFRVPLWFNKRISFWKLLGCGKNGTFDITPDWRQWGVILVWSEESGVWSQIDHPDSRLQTPDFLLRWWRFFKCEVCTITLRPVEGHGTWNGRQCFGQLSRQPRGEGIVAVLTRATIRLSKLKRFWQHVAPAAEPIKTTPGFISSVGIGEMPWVRQATFSIWENRDAMKAYAYQSAHAEVIGKTRAEGWYSEEMFVRFDVLGTEGTIRGKSPLERNA